MDAQIDREILAAHADSLNAGLRGSAAVPPMTVDQRRMLDPFLQLAEWLAETFVLVEPSPSFVRRLGQDLALASAQSQLSLLERYRRAILLMVATIGSALSLVGLLLFYLFRQRGTTESTTAS